MFLTKGAVQCTLHQVTAERAYSSSCVEIAAALPRWLSLYTKDGHPPPLPRKFCVTGHDIFARNRHCFFPRKYTHVRSRGTYRMTGRTVLPVSSPYRRSFRSGLRTATHNGICTTSRSERIVVAESTCALFGGRRRHACFVICS